MQCKVKIFFVLCLIACSGEDFGEPVNVALNKASNQSSIFLVPNGQEFPAENGVDGNLTTCINTLYENAPWWEVDLGHIVPILNITIYPRPRFYVRLASSDIFLDGQLCTTIRSLTTDNPLNLQCNHTMYGQTLKIIRKSPNFLQFCDFQVWVPQFISVCDAGKYGSDCKLNCPQHCTGGPDKSVCHLNTGTCYGAGGGHYGDDCMETCGQCANDAVCKRFTGHCPLCKVGLQPFLCKQECQGMTFGVNCSKACGKCRGGEPCNSVSGVCTKGCNPGWLPPDMCNTKCDLGYYGDGCNQTCGYCRFITQCRHDNGFCTAGCAAGFQGDLCIDATTSDGLLAGSILGGFVIIAASILIAVLVKRSRNRQDTVTVPSALCLSELQGKTDEISTHSPCAVQQLVDYEEIENTNTYDRLDPNSQNETSTYSPTVFKEIETFSQNDERVMSMKSAPN